MMAPTTLIQATQAGDDSREGAAPLNGAEQYPIFSGGPDEPDDALVPDSGTARAYSDDALALRFSDEHGENLRYTAAWGCWSVWTGSVWQTDKTHAVVNMARTVCRRESKGCDNARTSEKIASSQTIYAVEKLARADRRHAATVDQWDRDPWLLNTPGGVVDLKTGALLPAAREYYATKITAAAPGGACPKWRAFLERVTAGDRELEAFLQRMCGYSLTGVTSEHALFFAYGSGANGKSVFLNTISGLLKDYAKSAPIETFIDSRTQSHPTDLACLQGARLVTAIETEDGKRWAESKLKVLTGGDKVSARFMRQDFFSFIPQFKLIVAGNHKPSLRTVDEAMRRRFNLIPFAVTIPAADRDPELPEKLRAEWPGILQWAIDGCLAWQRDGLNPPAVVRQATDDYFAAEDSLARWLDDSTDRRDGTWSSSSALFQSWCEWAEASGEFAGTQKRFSENLAARGFQQHRRKTGAGFDGIILKSEAVKDGAGSLHYPPHARVRDMGNTQTLHHPTPEAEPVPVIVTEREVRV